MLCVVTAGPSSSRAIGISFKQKVRSNNGLAQFFSKSQARWRNPPDFGGEYAVYMMAEGHGTPEKPAFLPQNLDAPLLSPYTSAVPEMDEI
jgi:hypothetical protein